MAVYCKISCINSLHENLECLSCLKKYIIELEDKIERVKNLELGDGFEKIENLIYENGSLKAEIKELKQLSSLKIGRISKGKLKVDCNNLQKENVFLKQEIKRRKEHVTYLADLIENEYNRYKRDIFYEPNDEPNFFDYAPEEKYRGLITTLYNRVYTLKGICHK